MKKILTCLIVVLFCSFSDKISAQTATKKENNPKVAAANVMPEPEILNIQEHKPGREFNAGSYSWSIDNVTDINNSLEFVKRIKEGFKAAPVVFADFTNSQASMVFTASFNNDVSYEDFENYLRSAGLQYFQVNGTIKMLIDQTPKTH